MGLGDTVARRYAGLLRQTPFSLQRMTRSQTSTGDWLDTPATVATGRCYIQADTVGVAGERAGDVLTSTLPLLYLPPDLDVRVSDQIIVGSHTYQVRAIRNPDDTFRASLVVEGERLT